MPEPEILAPIWGRGPADPSRPALSVSVRGESEGERLGDADPATALDHGEERRAGALMLVGSEAHFRTVEDVLVALDRFHGLDEAVRGQVLARLLERRHREIGGDLAVDRTDIRLDLVPVLVAVEPGLGGRTQGVAIRHVREAHGIEPFGDAALGG